MSEDSVAEAILLGKKLAELVSRLLSTRPIILPREMYLSTLKTQSYLPKSEGEMLAGSDTRVRRGMAGSAQSFRPQRTPKPPLSVSLSWAKEGWKGLARLASLSMRLKERRGGAKGTSSLQKRAIRISSSSTIWPNSTAL